MFKKRKNYLRQIYKVNPETNTYMIEVSIDEYSEVFNGWDPSPIKRRDLEPDLLSFLEECAFDIPMKFPLEIIMYLNKDKMNTEKERLTKIGIHNNFNFTVHFIKKELHQISRKIITYIIIAFSFLAFAYLSKKNINLNVLTTTILEGFFIGGWVFLWEAFSLFFFSRKDINARLKRYVRFQDTEIKFIYKD